MKNNRMRFGDIITQQLVGIAMGMSPAPPIANLFMAIFERDHLLDKFEDFLILYLRFIDDGLGIWEHSTDKKLDAKKWNSFKSTLNNSGLTWEFTALDKNIDFMDISIDISEGKITTNLFQKPMTLHLYIPPNSNHPPGNFGSLINGMALRIHRLCSKKEDVNFWLKEFYSHLRDRGYKPYNLIPQLEKAISNAKKFIKRSPLQAEKMKCEKAILSLRKSLSI